MVEGKNATSVTAGGEEETRIGVNAVRTIGTVTGWIATANAPSCSTRLTAARAATAASMVTAGSRAIIRAEAASRAVSAEWVTIAKVAAASALTRTIIIAAGATATCRRSTAT